jgi:hypothetical protein
MRPAPSKGQWTQLFLRSSREGNLKNGGGNDFVTGKRGAHGVNFVYNRRVSPAGKVPLLSHCNKSMRIGLY